MSPTLSLRVMSVNIGCAENLTTRSGVVRTGIFKRPVQGPHEVTVAGMAEDVRVAPRMYGDEYHALHAYPLEHHAYWNDHVGLHSTGAGFFGENLSTLGGLERDVCLGDRMVCGTSVLEVTQPRIPCRKLSARVGIENFASLFLESLRVGYYLRVISPGIVCAGDTFVRVERLPEAPTMEEMLRVSQLDPWDVIGLEQIARCRALPPVWREVIAEKLERARAAASAGTWFGTRRCLVTARREASSQHTVLTLECPYGRGLVAFRARDVLTVIEPGLRRHGPRTECLLASDPVRVGTYEIVTARESVLARTQPGTLLRCLAPHAPSRGIKSE